MTPRTLYLTASDAQNQQFESSGELRSVRLSCAEALKADDAEQAYIQRIVCLVSACRCGSGELAMPLIERREQLDRAQRSATEQAQQHADLASTFQRTANGLLDRALAGLRALSDLGKRGVSA